MTARTRKASTTSTPADAPNATPAPVQAAPNAQGTDATVTAVETDQAATPAYVIPTGWETDQAAYVATVGEAYRSADKSGKAAIRSAWNKFQTDALNELNMDKLAVLRDVLAVMVTTKAPVEVDPADGYVIHLAALSMASATARATFREAHGDEVTNAMLERLTNLTDDERKSAQSLAAKLAVVKSGSRRTGPQRSVEAHIRSALDAAPKGTILTCAQVRNHRSDAYGPDDSPSVGAIGAAYGREMDGIESVVNDAKVKGYRLA
jgi:hypothetical protein